MKNSTLCKKNSKIDANKTNHLGFDGLSIDSKRKEEQI
jgi:hypothetical protein